MSIIYFFAYVSHLNVSLKSHVISLYRSYTLDLSLATWFFYVCKLYLYSKCQFLFVAVYEVKLFNPDFSNFVNLLTLKIMFYL